MIFKSGSQYKEKHPMLLDCRETLKKMVLTTENTQNETKKNINNSVEL